MVQFILLSIPLPLFGFWFWMFRDMMNNEYISGKEKNDWLVRFVFLTIFGAYWYYQVEYRNRHL